MTISNINRRGVAAAICLFLFATGNTGAGAQDIAISGRVRDIHTRIGLSSVNVYIKGTRTGTVTGAGGEFRLVLSRTSPGRVLIFRHVGYDILELPLDSVETYYFVEMQPRVIPLQELNVEAESERLEVHQDLPQAVSVMKEEVFAGRGYTDAADLLSLDHSIQVDEEISGKKTVGIRGGNPDEVVVLYNHVKLNNTFDHIFDLSFVDLDDIKRVEIIKGSNTSLYGIGSLSGIINLVPKIEQDYHFKFQQRVGTYRSGNWGLQLYQDIKGLQTSYSYKEGAMHRHYANSTTSNNLENHARHHIVNLRYNLPHEGNLLSDNHLGAMFIHSTLGYSNERDEESLSNSNQVLSFHFQGDLFFIKKLAVLGSMHQLDETQQLVFSDYTSTRRIMNDVMNLSVEKTFKARYIEMLFAYQIEDAGLRFRDHQDRSSTVGTTGVTYFDRIHHGFAAISKWHAPSGFDFVSSMDFDISYRMDRVEDRKSETALQHGSSTPKTPPDRDDWESNRWNESMVKFSAHLNGNREDILFSAYMNYGKNVKFPTLFQQIQVPAYLSIGPVRPILQPERNRSTEIGFEMMQTVENHPQFYGWQVAGFFFKNYYDNKFRTFYTPGIPVAYYDNVRTANITGIEVESAIFLFKKKVTLEIGYAKYFISDKSAFPFRYDTKATVDLKFNHAGYALDLHVFTEGDQVGWIRHYGGTFAQVDLPGYADLDIHMSKQLELYGFKARMSASVRNLMNHETTLSGLPLRDRRIYLTLGIQY